MRSGSGGHSEGPQSKATDRQTGADGAGGERGLLGGPAAKAADQTDGAGRRARRRRQVRHRLRSRTADSHPPALRLDTERPYGLSPARTTRVMGIAERVSDN